MSLREPFFDLRDPDAEADPVESSFDLLRPAFFLGESREGCCGEVSTELSEDGPALDISAAVDALLPFLRSSAGVAGPAGSVLLPRARLGRRLACEGAGGGSAAALRFLDAGSGRIAGGEPASVAVEGE